MTTNMKLVIAAILWSFLIFHIDAFHIAVKYGLSWIIFGFVLLSIDKE